MTELLDLARRVETVFRESAPLPGAVIQERTRGAEAVAHAVSVRATTIEQALARIAAVEGVRVPGPRPREWEEERELHDGTTLHVARAPAVFAADPHCSWRAFLYNAPCTEHVLGTLLWRADLYGDAQAALRELRARKPTATSPATERSRWGDAVCQWASIAEWALNVRSPGMMFDRGWQGSWPIAPIVGAPAEQSIRAAGFSGDRDAQAGWRLGADPVGTPAVPAAARTIIDRLLERIRTLGAPDDARLIVPMSAWSWAWDVEESRPVGLTSVRYTGEGRGARAILDGRFLQPFDDPHVSTASMALGCDVFRIGDARDWRVTDGVVVAILDSVAQSIVDQDYGAQIGAAFVRYYDYLLTFDLELLGLTPVEVSELRAELERARAEAEAAARASFLAGFAAVGAALAGGGPIGAIIGVVVVVIGALIELLLALVGTARGSCGRIPGPLFLRSVSDPMCLAIPADDRVLGGMVLGSISSAEVGGLAIPPPPAPLVAALAKAREERDAIVAATDAAEADRRRTLLTVLGFAVAAAAIGAG